VKTLRAVLLGLALTLALAACGGDDDGDSADTTAEDTTTTLSEEDEKAAVEKVTTDFFAALTGGDTDTGASLLENGEENKPKLAHCAKDFPGITITMKSVTLDSETEASSVFDISIDGEVVLPDAACTAVKVDGEWLIGEETYLSLYDLAKDTCTGPAPPA
jgi:hypothetical protein